MKCYDGIMQLLVKICETKYRSAEGKRVKYIKDSLIDEHLEELDLFHNDEYVLTFNGAIVKEVGPDRVICRDTLKGSDLKYLYEVSKNAGVNIHAFSNFGCVTPKMNKYTELEGRINGIEVCEADYNDIKEDEEIIKIMMIDEPEVLEEGIK
ncbi:HAD hydrolase family protein, partial [Bacillus bombysepticus]|nr:HAD hydrolase family protein [Bacillus bombysepticus]